MDSILKQNTKNIIDFSYYTNNSMNYRCSAFFKFLYNILSKNLEEKRTDIIELYSSEDLKLIITLDNPKGLLPIDALLFDIFQLFPELSSLFDKNVDLVNLLNNISKKILKEKNEFKLLDCNINVINRPENFIKFYKDTISLSENPSLSNLYSQIIEIIYNTGTLNYEFGDSNFIDLKNVFDTTKDSTETEEWLMCAPRKSDYSSSGFIDMAFSAIVNNDPHFYNIIKSVKNTKK